MIEVRETKIDENDAKTMRKELSDRLYEITGNSGAKSFDCEDMNQKRAVFVVAYNGDEPCGCGAIREMNDKTAELKRVYAKYTGYGIGTKVVEYLERKAVDLGYKEIMLETRVINENAVGFYLQHGFLICDNFGKYAGRKDAVCFQKVLR